MARLRKKQQLKLNAVTIYIYSSKIKKIKPVRNRKF